MQNYFHQSPLHSDGVHPEYLYTPQLQYPQLQHPQLYHQPQYPLQHSSRPVIPFENNLQPALYQYPQQSSFMPPYDHNSSNQIQIPEHQRRPDDSDLNEFTNEAPFFQAKSTVSSTTVSQSIPVGSDLPAFNENRQSSLISHPAMRNLSPPRTSTSPTPSLLPRKRETKNEREERKQKGKRDKRMQQINEYINRVENKTLQDSADQQETFRILQNLLNRADGIVGPIRHYDTVNYM